MTQSALGALLRHLREEKKLSLRDVAQLAGIDHAYIYRLETGDKVSPSEEIVSKLIRALKPGRREAEMLHYLAKNPETNSPLVTIVLTDPTISFEIFTTAAGTRFRGERPSPEKLIERARRAHKIMVEEHGDR